MKYLFFAIRPTHWIKNSFVFLPLVFGRELFNPYALFKTTFMFFIFSLAASSVYLINDIIDLDSDRLHPLKRQRPLASGKVTVFRAKSAAFVLGSIAILFSFILGRAAGSVIIIYIILNYAYMKILKNVAILDVFCIAAFFYLRILAGAVINRIILSNLFILCIVLLALFLALNKRRYDLKLSGGSHHVYTKYNMYFVDRMIYITSFSLVVSYSFYVMHIKTMERLGTPHLYYTLPFVYYGLFRYLYLIDKREASGDPVRILFKDHKLQLNLALWLIVCIMAIYFGL